MSNFTHLLRYLFRQLRSERAEANMVTAVGAATAVGLGILLVRSLMPLSMGTGATILDDKIECAGSGASCNVDYSALPPLVPPAYSPPVINPADATTGDASFANSGDPSQPTNGTDAQPLGTGNPTTLTNYFTANPDATLSFNNIVPFDTNGDGTIDTVAIDTNGDGQPDVIAPVDGDVVSLSDTNGDGLPDTYLFNIDGNTVPIQAVSQPQPQPQPQGQPSLPDTLASAPSPIAFEDLTPIDLNGDGVADAVTIDINGDGTPDYLQPVDGDTLSLADTNGDGLPDTYQIDTNGDGTQDLSLSIFGPPGSANAPTDYGPNLALPEFISPNSNSDGAVQNYAIDTNGDGEVDTTLPVVGQSPFIRDLNGDGFADVLFDTDGNGSVDQSLQATPDQLALENLTPVDTNGDGQVNGVAIDIDGNGTPDYFQPVDGDTLSLTDTNGDGLPDTYQIDTNGDGTQDLSLSVLTPPEPTQLGIDLTLGDFVPTDQNSDGVVDGYAVDANGDGQLDTILPIDGQSLNVFDVNGDGSSDIVYDSNGDGVPDQTLLSVPGPLDTNGDGVIDPGKFASANDCFASGVCNSTWFNQQFRDYAAADNIQLFDVNEDGIVDNFGIDINGNGEFDVYDRVDGSGGVRFRDGGFVDVDLNGDGVFDLTQYNTIDLRWQDEIDGKDYNLWFSPDNEDARLFRNSETVFISDAGLNFGGADDSLFLWNANGCPLDCSLTPDQANGLIITDQQIQTGREIASVFDYVYYDRYQIGENGRETYKSYLSQSSGDELIARGFGDYLTPFSETDTKGSGENVEFFTRTGYKPAPGLSEALAAYAGLPPGAYFEVPSPDADEPVDLPWFSDESNILPSEANRAYTDAVVNQKIDAKQRVDRSFFGGILRTLGGFVVGGVTTALCGPCSIAAVGAYNYIYNGVESGDWSPGNLARNLVVGAIDYFVPGVGGSLLSNVANDYLEDGVLTGGEVTNALVSAGVQIGTDQLGNVIDDIDFISPEVGDIIAGNVINTVISGDIESGLISTGGQIIGNEVGNAVVDAGASPEVGNIVSTVSGNGIIAIGEGQTFEEYINTTVPALEGPITNIVADGVTDLIEPPEEPSDGYTFLVDEDGNPVTTELPSLTGEPVQPTNGLNVSSNATLGNIADIGVLGAFDTPQNTATVVNDDGSYSVNIQAPNSILDTQRLLVNADRDAILNEATGEQVRQLDQRHYEYTYSNGDTLELKTSPSGRFVYVSANGEPPTFIRNSLTSTSPEEIIFQVINAAAPDAESRSNAQNTLGALSYDGWTSDILCTNGTCNALDANFRGYRITNEGWLVVDNGVDTQVLSPELNQADVDDALAAYPTNTRASWLGNVLLRGTETVGFGLGLFDDIFGGFTGLGNHQTTAVTPNDIPTNGGRNIFDGTPLRENTPNNPNAIADVPQGINRDNTSGSVPNGTTATIDPPVNTTQPNTDNTSGSVPNGTTATIDPPVNTTQPNTDNTSGNVVGSENTTDSSTTFDPGVFVAPNGEVVARSEPEGFNERFANGTLTNDEIAQLTTNQRDLYEFRNGASDNNPFFNPNTSDGTNSVDGVSGENSNSNTSSPPPSNPNGEERQDLSNDGQPAIDVPAVPIGDGNGNGGDGNGNGGDGNGNGGDGNSTPNEPGDGSNTNQGFGFGPAQIVFHNNGDGSRCVTCQFEFATGVVYGNEFINFWPPETFSPYTFGDRNATDPAVPGPIAQQFNIVGGDGTLQIGTFDLTKPVGERWSFDEVTPDVPFRYNIFDSRAPGYFFDNLRFSTIPNHVSGVKVGYTFRIGRGVATDPVNPTDPFDVLNRNQTPVTLVEPDRDPDLRQPPTFIPPTIIDPTVLPENISFAPTNPELDYDFTNADFLDPNTNYVILEDPTGIQLAYPLPGLADFQPDQQPGQADPANSSVPEQGGSQPVEQPPVSGQNQPPAFTPQTIVDPTVLPEDISFAPTNPELDYDFTNVDFLDPNTNYILLEDPSGIQILYPFPNVEPQQPLPDLREIPNQSQPEPLPVLLPPLVPIETDPPLSFPDQQQAAPLPESDGVDSQDTTEGADQSPGGELVPSPGGELVPSPGGAIVPSPGGELVPSPGGAIVPSPGGAIVPSSGD